MVLRGFIFTLLFILAAVVLLAQSTVEPEKKVRPAAEKKNLPDVKTGQILIIPFDPRLYMSEIDKNIWKETGMNFNQIRSTFRYGLDRTLETKLKGRHTVVSLLADSNKTARDIQYIYKSIGYSHDLVPPENTSNQNAQGPAAVKESKPAVPKSKIVNGELVVGVNYDKRFMNTVISNPHLLPYLNKKYKSGIFVFINELDIKNDFTKPYQDKTDTYRREITVHYSIFDKTGKPLAAGIATSHFSPATNIPKKIVDNYFASLSKQISDKLFESLAIQEKQQVKEKK